MRTPTRTFILSLALVMYGSGAQAYESTAQVIKRQAPAGISNVFYGCVEKAESDTIALAECQSAEKKRQDARLNIAYSSLLSKQRGTDKEKLIRAERDWLDFHSTSNAFEASLYGSETVSSFQVMQRDIFRLCERANVLEEYLSIANDR
ncbi:lysozyme inhibitor LprI family protein [Stenotrophomonas rhizophila]|uniref:lysozyme inhibitor LprI family protein n=1 Tax=Stenotrophomonas rhizophila TaxID=216778 RepID=UPI002A69886F|nr:lysozyme inhibitor LprI family protein [Stenotrophomonas rhizophila]MDY0956313.1 lysozyme inhibitor LprI family protein [Stenotrophomonas rhizophila]